MKPIRKAIFPVAGLGTRFLPATKAMPKEMLTVVDRPLIQHVVDEAREAGIEHLIFVTGRNKSVIEDHFDRQFELEVTLKERHKKSELKQLAEDTPGAGTTSFTRQQSPLGLGHAVWCARELVGNEPFAVRAAGRAGAERTRLPRADGRRPMTSRRARPTSSRSKKCRSIACTCTASSASARKRVKGTAARHCRSRRWSRSPSARTRPPIFRSPAATSCSRKSFDILENQQTGAGGEIQLTDAMIALSKTQPFYAVKFDGRSYDCGSKLGFLTANIAYALKRKDIAPELREELKALLG